jgi:hypothetical protein
MSYTVSTPEMLAAAAADAEQIGSTIGAASSNAAGPTTNLLAAAQDEVSAAIAELFGAYGRQYQGFLANAVAFHDQFTRALASAAGGYTQAEATSAALLSTLPSATGDPRYALIMGGTFNPTPDPSYVNSVYNSYIKPLNPAAIPQPIFTPEQFWPVTPQLGNLTFAQSVAKGVTLLNTQLTTLLADQTNSAVVFGYSQSATIATNEIRDLIAAGSPYQGQLSFVLVGNPNNPVGGLLERFPGFYLPLLDVPFNGATPASPYHTTTYTIQYDGIANAPQYPLNVVSDLNALMGYFEVHSNYPSLTPTQIGDAVALPTNGGNSDYYMIMTQNLPLLDPIRAIPYAGPPIADIFQPDLRVLVDLGYGDFGPGLDYANVPTPAGLLSIPNPFTVIPDLALGTVQAPYGAAVEIGVEAGLLSPSYFPTTYPWTPSVAPHLNFLLGQPSTTLLSVLSGAGGDVLHVIPPIANTLLPI